MKVDIINKGLLSCLVILLSACGGDSVVKPVFSVSVEPGFDGYYVQTSENKFLSLDQITRTSFKENVKIKEVTYSFCETYSSSEFLKITKIKLTDYQINAVKGDSGREVGNEYRLYKMENISDSATPGIIQLCAQEVKSKLAVHGTTIKVKAVEPLTKAIYYIKDKTWFMNKKSRFFILN